MKNLPKPLKYFIAIIAVLTLPLWAVPVALVIVFRVLVEITYALIFGEN